jgi:glycosyltransferase involved in cell wall biosynthesis
VKVALVGFQAVSILRGGPSTQIRKTAEALRTLGVDASLFDPWTPFDRGSADIVHLFSAGVGTYHLAREIRALGIPLVVSPITYSTHSPFFVRAGLALTRVLQGVRQGFWSDYAFVADTCSWAARVVPNSRAEAELVIRGLGVERGRVVVVPNGVDEGFAQGDPALFQQRYGVRDYILNVGHIGHPRKNVLALIQALGSMDRPAVIIGRIIDGEYGRACVREAEKHPQIRLIDGLENDSALLRSAYAGAEVFVLPSLFETPGIAALEAGLAGARVVITPHGGTQEYFEDLATYVDPRSVSSIRDGILRALTLPKDGRLQERIRQKYLWSRVAEETLAVYRLALEREAG